MIVHSPVLDLKARSRESITTYKVYPIVQLGVQIFEMY